MERRDTEKIFKEHNLIASYHEAKREQERQAHVNELLSKQSDVSLNSINQRIEFDVRSEVNQGDYFRGGVQSLDVFKQQEKLEQTATNLKSKGLTQEELQFELQREGFELPKEKRKLGFGKDPYEQTLIEQEISKKLKTHDSNLEKQRDDKVNSIEEESSNQIEPIQKLDIISNRISLEEIYKLPRFHDYSAGAPNNTLYLKNLSPKVTENDLIQLFIRFQKPCGHPIKYTLMKKGKMKNQAFVTLENIQEAVLALDLLNGYLLHGKPMIIQFGGKKNE